MREDPDAREIARNAGTQNRYRDVNERVMEANARFALPGEEHRLVEVMCECGKASCADRVEITRDIYERLRSDPATFVLKHGHEDGLVEAVVERAPGYVIAANIGAAARIAVDGDPRRLP
jgi:hypothetical protein